MRRDYVTLDVRNVGHGGEDRPTVVLEFDGPGGLLEERLVDVDGDRLNDDQIDVAYRLRSTADDGGAGVFSLANRVTGEFVLEVDADADDVLGLVRTAREVGDRGDGDGCYRIEIRADGETEATYEKRTLLVYDGDGDLLRQDSLIPSGVEL